MRHPSPFADLLGLLGPRFCSACNARLAPSERIVCAECLLRMPYTYIDDYRHNRVVSLFLGKMPIERGYSHFLYGRDAHTHGLVMLLKYQHRPDVGRELGRQVAAQLAPRGFFDGIDAIVPVPLHWLRLLRRGYNQSTQLAFGVAKATGLPLACSLLRRTVNNKPQASISGALQRADNVRGIFKARRTGLRHLLLVDDILTTGSTLAACGQALAAANPSVRLSVLTLCSGSAGVR